MDSSSLLPGHAVPSVPPLRSAAGVEWSATKLAGKSPTRPSLSPSHHPWSESDRSTRIIAPLLNVRSPEDKPPGMHEPIVLLTAKGGNRVSGESGERTFGARAGEVVESLNVEGILLLILFKQPRPRRASGGRLRCSPQSIDEERPADGADEEEEKGPQAATARYTPIRSLALKLLE